MEVRVLVVDDSAVVAETMASILTARGYLVEILGDGMSGWERLIAGVEDRAPMPDMVLLDINMPGMDGLTLLRRLRGDERFALLPVIIMTVEADAATRLRALELGANDYLPKPVQTLELLARLKTLLDWKLAERRQEQRMKNLIEAGKMLLSTLDLDLILQRVMQLAMVEMDAEGTSIWLRDADESIECRAAAGRGAERLVGVWLNPGQGIAGWVLQNKQSVLVNNAQTDPRFYRGIDAQLGFRTRDLIAVPLLVKEAGIGVLEAVNKKQEPFSPTDLAWMEVLGSLAAAAIANARLVQVLRHRTYQLEARNEELDAFAHTVAHDLKAPLSSIIGFAETLEMTCPDLSSEEICRHLQTIGRGGRKMGRIIDELLLLAGVRKMDVELQPLDMAGIVAEAIQRLDGMVKESQVKFQIPSAWPTALGYAPWVEEVWANYISNAIKYGGRPPVVELGFSVSDAGRSPAEAPPQIRMQASARTSERASGQTIRFWVRDNGAGLSPEAQARLFAPFTRLDQTRAQGHGLGLSIVRRIVEKLGGQVGVESEVGRGSVFYFTLPGGSV